MTGVEQDDRGGVQDDRGGCRFTHGDYRDGSLWLPSL